MKSRVIVLALLSLVAAQAASAKFDSAAEVKRAVQSSLDKFVAAWKKLDVKAASNVFADITAPEFVATDVGTGAKTGREDILKTYGARMQSISKILLYDAKIVDVKVVKDIANVSLSYHVKTKVPEKGKADHTMEIWQSSKTVWAKTKAGWKMRASATSLQKALMDGVPLTNPGTGKKGG